MGLPQIPPAKRLTEVESIGGGDQGDSLAGQNVNNYQDGALFWVRASHRMYELRKNLNSAVVQTDDLNVVDGIGSSAAAGRFVATQQWATGVLSVGSIAIPGFDIMHGGRFLVSYVSAGGTQGFLHAAQTAVNIVTVTSSSGSDTSTVVVMFLENPE